MSRTDAMAASNTLAQKRAISPSLFTQPVLAQ